MDGLKMVRIFLALTLAMSVASQPLDNIATSGAATLSTQVLNWAQVGFEAFLEWAKRGFGLCTEDNTTCEQKKYVIEFSCQKLRFGHILPTKEHQKLEIHNLLLGFK